MEDTSSEDLKKSVSLMKRSRSITALLLLIAAAVLISIAGRQLLNRHSATTGTSPPPDSSRVITEDITEPDESKVNNDEYQVPADQPRLITVPKINAIGPIQKVGNTKENAIAAPSNIHFAGWYVSSVKPGDAGLSIIDGHVSGKYVDGIFKQLKEVKPGDQIVIEYGDASRRIFEAVEIKTIPEAESAEFLLTKRDDIEQQLNLITCGGTFDRNTQKYTDRVVVVTKMV